MATCGQVTVAAGHTDLCRLSCTGPDSHLRFRENLRQALDILSFLPNVIIALVLPLDPSLVQAALHRPVSCQLLARHRCPCVATGQAKPRQAFLADLQLYRGVVRDLATQYQVINNLTLVPTSRYSTC